MLFPISDFLFRTMLTFFYEASVDLFYSSLVFSFDCAVMFSRNGSASTPCFLRLPSQIEMDSLE